MYKAVITCVLFFVLCEAKIKIKITVASNVSNAKIEYEGEDNKSISDMEIKLFNFTKENLSRGMRVQFGKAPDDIFWKNPTRYGNVFERFQASPSPVKRNIKIKKARIINVFSQNKVILTTNPGKENPEDLKWHFDNNINSTWSSTGVPNDTIYFDVKIQIDNNAIEYQDTWRNHTMINFVFGLSKEEYYNIQTGLRTINGRLTSIETIVLTEIEYSAKLIGNVVGILDQHEYKNFRIYTPQLNDIMKAANIVNDIKTTQKIEIRYYTVPKFEVYDMKLDRYKQITLSSNMKNCDRLKVKLAEAKDKLVVIYFMDSGCRQCEIIAPKIIQMADGIVLHTVDVMECKEIATEYNIIKLPAFVFIKNSKEIDELSGPCAYVEKLNSTILKYK